MDALGFNQIGLSVERGRNRYELADHHDLADEGDGDPANGYNEFEDCIGAAPPKMRRKYRKKYDAVSLMYVRAVYAVDATHLFDGARET